MQRKKKLSLAYRQKKFEKSDKVNHQTYQSELTKVRTIVHTIVRTTL